MRTQRESSALCFAFFVLVAVQHSSAQCESQELAARDAGEQDFFGHSVAATADVLVVGAPDDDDLGENTGSAYVYTRTREGWVFAQKLHGDSSQPYTVFGWEVATEGKWLFVGAAGENDSAGAVHVFRRSGHVWTKATTLVATDERTPRFFGKSIAVCGKRALIGAPGTGTAFVFTLDDDTWTQSQVLSVPSVYPGNHHFGEAVELSEDWAIVGEPQGFGFVGNSGAAHVFCFDGARWIHDHTLFASDGEHNDKFGTAVGLCGDIALIGAPYDDYDDARFGSGSVYVFRSGEGRWTEEQKLVQQAEQPDYWFGTSVSIVGNNAVVGAPSGIGTRGSRIPV